MKPFRILIFSLCIACFFQCTQNKESAILQPGVPHKVSTGAENTSFSYYNTTPENPDGSKIAYTKFLANPQNERNEKVPAEIWICNSDLTHHRKVTAIHSIGVHNGARVQWLDNQSFVYEDDSIRAVNLDGQPLIKPFAGRTGHEPLNGKFLFSGKNERTGFSTIYEYDVKNQNLKTIADASDFAEVKNLYPADELREVSDFNILHLHYNTDGTKISFRLDIGPKNEKYNHLVIMNIDGSGIRYFGPKPMHFSWFDENTIMGHDNQINDGLPNDKSGRRWDVNRNVVETLSGPGNHFAASPNRNIIASETWYNSNPVVLHTFKRGEIQSFWSDTISSDFKTTWKLANHANPSFSRDGKRLYFNKCTAPGKVFAYVIVLPEN